MTHSPKNPNLGFAAAAQILQGGHAVAQAYFNQRRHIGEPFDLPKEVKDILDHPLEHFQRQTGKVSAAGAPEALTHVAFILDKSSSMSTGRDVTIEGFNKQVDIVSEGAKEVGKTLFTFTQFSDQVEVQNVATSLDHMGKLTPQTYQPSGMTALYDALGDTLAALLRTPHIEAATTATLVTLFTDGEENVSRRYTPKVLSELIKRLEATGRWTFALVGPRGSVTDLAKLLSVPLSNVQGYDPVSVQDRQMAFGAMASASTAYLSARSVGATQAYNLYDVKPDDKA